MAYAKRIAICVLLGFLAGLFCWYGAVYIGMKVTAEQAVGIVTNRVTLGLVIGISSLELAFLPKKIGYLTHGLLIAFLISWPFALYGGNWGFNGFLYFGLAYGLIIEFLSTKVLGAPMKN
ncbi:Uncharacterised protein [Candidatus Gugararchaeum adminiculabundum]|nr:Uncharacterised protein [Candidatus Gugararchaeum adminiculabundum]